MSTSSQLKSRWKSFPGCKIQERLFSLGLVHPNHGCESEAIFQLLSDLPFREEVSNGRDFRGLNMAASDLDLSFCDFSHAQITSLYSCKLMNAIFDHCFAERATFGSNLTSSSFVSAKLKSCYFNGSIAENCDFSNSHLFGCSFQNADLQGAKFINADCRRVSFAGAKLIGCDFAGANLEQAVFCDVLLDKSTNFRGANVSNVINSDWIDSKGNVTRKGTDLKLGTI
jgi:uncharacterized protein YjbI with pentapeptide repeats